MIPPEHPQDLVGFMRVAFLKMHLILKESKAFWNKKKYFNLKNINFFLNIKTIHFEWFWSSYFLNEKINKCFSVAKWAFCIRKFRAKSFIQLHLKIDRAWPCLCGKKHAQTISGLGQLLPPPLRWTQLRHGCMDQLEAHTADAAVINSPRWGDVPSCGQLGAWPLGQGGQACPHSHGQLRAAGTKRTGAEAGRQVFLLPGNGPAACPHPELGCWAAPDPPPRERAVETVHKKHR